MSDKADDSEDEPVNFTTSTLTNNLIDPMEGTSSEDTASPIDESSNDSTTLSVTLSNPGEAVKCTKCLENATLSFYKHRESPTGGKKEDIFKNHCDHCKFFFGMCCKKVRGVFSYVTEEGRILSNSEKMEYFRTEKRRMSISRSNSTCQEKEAEVEPGNSDTSTNGNSDEKEEIKEEDEGIDEKMEEDDQEETHQRNTATRKKPKKHVFGGKSKKTNWSTSRKKNKVKVAQNQSTSVDSESISAKKVTINGPIKKARKDRENSRPKESSSKVTTTATTVEEKKRGRPLKNSSKVTNSSNIPSTSSEVLTRSPVKTVATKMMESSCQTDTELLLKSTYLKDSFNQTIRDGLGEQIAARLKDQPLMLRKQFLIMMKTIQEQEALISKYQGTEKQYQMAIRKLKDFGRSTRLEFSDSFRNIRADLVERKEEFKAHEAEVASIIKRQKSKYEAYKAEMMKKYEDQKLEYAALEAKVEYLEQERIYEKDRAEFFLRTRDVAVKEKNLAIETADTAVKNLNDRLYLADNETCSRCQAVERIRKKMTQEVAEMTEKTEKAVAERNDAVEKATLFESAAQKLGKDCDSIKYERESWKAYAERYKKDVLKLTQTLKEKEKEILDKAAELAATPKSIATPRSVACTPNDGERVSPPEDGEIAGTPPQGSPRYSNSKSVVKPLLQKIAERKAPPIASGFESWIPKNKLNAPAPEIPKAISAFGVPIKPPQQKDSSFGPSSQPAPWEKLSQTNADITSNSLSEALSQVQAESFMGGGSTPSYNSKTYTEEINRMMKARKRVKEEPEEQQQKPTSSDSPAPPIKKVKPTTPSQITAVPSKIVASSSTPTSSSSTPNPNLSVGSLSNLKKIPKLSEKPAQAEFAPALGLTVKNENSSSIPGLGMGKLDEETKEKEKEAIMKIKPAVAKPSTLATENNQKVSTNHNQSEQNAKINSLNKPPPKKNKINSTPKKKNNNKPTIRSESSFSQPDPWHRHHQDSPPQNHPPWLSQSSSHQPQYGIQSNQQRNYQMDRGLDRPWSDALPSQRNGGRLNESFSALPWHRAQDTPFGKVPIQDNFAMSGPRPMPPRPFPPQQHQQQPSFYNGPRDNSFYPPARDFSPPRPSHPPHPSQSRMFNSPPFGYSGPPNMGRGNIRPFYS